MSGDRHHYLPAALIGGFGEPRSGQPLRKAQIAVRELGSGLVHPAAAEDVAFRHALYRLDSANGVDPDIVDHLWQRVEAELPTLVGRLTDGLLTADDPEILVAYAAMAGVRHPTAFEVNAIEHQRRRGAPRPVGDQIQVMRVEAVLNGLKAMTSWRWRVLHSSADAPRFVISDRGWGYIREPLRDAHALWVPLGPRVGILGYLDTPGLPPKTTPFSEHRDLALSWVEWFNATAWSDNTITHAVFAHPDQKGLLEEALPPKSVTPLGPFRGRHWAAPTLLD